MVRPDRPSAARRYPGTGPRRFHARFQR